MTSHRKSLDANAAFTANYISKFIAVAYVSNFHFVHLEIPMTSILRPRYQSNPSQDEEPRRDALAPAEEAAEAKQPETDEVSAADADPAQRTQYFQV